MLDFITQVERFLSGHVFAFVHTAPSEFVCDSISGLICNRACLQVNSEEGKSHEHCCEHSLAATMSYLFELAIKMQFRFVGFHLNG